MVRVLKQYWQHGLVAGLMLMLAIASPLLAQNKVGTTAGQFLKIGVGPRAESMGEAYVAVANDVSSIYWNPAGTATLQENQIQFGYNDWFMDVVYNHAYGAFPVPRFGTVGIQVSSLTMGDMKVRTPEKQEGTGEYFTASDITMGLNYARSLTDRFAIGFNFKYIGENIWHMNAHSFALDVGTLFTTQFNGMRLGMSISNFGSKMQMSGRDALVKYDVAPELYGNNPNINANLQMGQWSLPLIFRLGVAMDVIKSNFITTTVAMDAIHPNDNTEYVNTGVEVKFLNNVFLRAGYKSLFNDRYAERATVGAGVRLNLFSGSSIMIDYSYSDVNYLMPIQRFAVSLGM